MRINLRLSAFFIATVVLLGLAGCGNGGEGGGYGSQRLSNSHSSPSTSASATPSCGGEWSCKQLDFDAAKNYVASKPGHLGVVVRDRQTGAVWSAGTTDHPVWTASTIKLALATDLLEQNRAGSIHLSASERQLMAEMLNWSSNDAAMTLWNRYGNDAMVARWSTRFGMTGVTFVDGFTRNWGFMKCTTNDLAALMSYVLDKANPDDRAYLVNALQNVAQNQHWGVWAAGSKLHPGNKDGWSLESDDGKKNWIIDTVGFAGPQQRYVVALMYQQLPSGTLPVGVQTVSDVVALLFGESTPAQIVIPEPDG